MLILIWLAAAVAHHLAEPRNLTERRRKPWQADQGNWTNQRAMHHQISAIGIWSWVTPFLVGQGDFSIPILRDL